MEIRNQGHEQQHRRESRHHYRREQRTWRGVYQSLDLVALSDAHGHGGLPPRRSTRRAPSTGLAPCAERPERWIDEMINIAGLMPQASLERLKIDEWNRMIDVNIKGVPYSIAPALPPMKQRKAGHFINLSSVAGHQVGPGFAIYAATKHAV
jgi:NAD(P)-dependent dehydrogenase (short-subunit alcohol dehydrogenase family)